MTLANPVKAQWLDGQSQKIDRVDAKQLARFLWLDEVPASYVPPPKIRRYRSLVRGRKKLVNKQTDFKNEIHATLDQNGVTFEGLLWSDEGRAFLEDLSLEKPAEILLEQWLTAIDEFEKKIHRLQRCIEECANEVEAVVRLMTVPGIAAFSGLMIYAEIGEVDRFNKASELVSYAGLDPVVKASGKTRTEGSISKDGNGYLRWILVQWASTAVFNAKDPYLHEFYRRLRERRNKPHKVAIVATARKLLVSVFHMLSKEEVYDPVR